MKVQQMNLLKREEIFGRRRQKSLTKQIGFIRTDSHICYHQNEKKKKTVTKCV